MLQLCYVFLLQLFLPCFVVVQKMLRLSSRCFLGRVTWCLRHQSLLESDPALLLSESMSLPPSSSFMSWPSSSSSSEVSSASALSLAGSPQAVGLFFSGLYRCHQVTLHTCLIQLVRVAACTAVSSPMPFFVGHPNLAAIGCDGFRGAPSCLWGHSHMM